MGSVAFVYFSTFEDQEGKWCKVGRSDEPYGERLRQHRRGSLGLAPQNFHDVVCLRANGNDERAVKDYFRGDLRPGQTEVFFPTDRITDYIRWLRDQHFAYVPDDGECDPLESLETADAALWLPNPERRKSPGFGEANPDWPLFPNEVADTRDKLHFPPRQMTNDDFYTPPVILQAVRETFDDAGIDLDPASCARANAKVKATKIYTVQENGLLQPWAGTVWLNPPFSLYPEFAAKLMEELDGGAVEDVCLYASVRSLPSLYFSPLLKRSSALCITEGRIPCWGSLATLAPTDGHAIVYFGPNPWGFIQAFSQIGPTFRTSPWCYDKEENHKT